MLLFFIAKSTIILEPTASLLPVIHDERTGRFIDTMSLAADSFYSEVITKKCWLDNAEFYVLVMCLASNPNCLSMNVDGLYWILSVDSLTVRN